MSYFKLFFVCVSVVSQYPNKPSCYDSLKSCKLIISAEKLCDAWTQHSSLFDKIKFQHSGLISVSASFWFASAFEILPLITILRHSGQENVWNCCVKPLCFDAVKMHCVMGEIRRHFKKFLTSSQELHYSIELSLGSCYCVTLHEVISQLFLN